MTTNDPIMVLSKPVGRLCFQIIAHWSIKYYFKVNTLVYLSEFRSKSIFIQYTCTLKRIAHQYLHTQRSLYFKNRIYRLRTKNLDSTGPDTWGKDFPIADGQQQSPIDLVTSEAEYDASIQGSNPLAVKYTPEPEVNLVNNGHSIMCQITQQGGKLRRMIRLSGVGA